METARIVRGCFTIERAREAPFSLGVRIDTDSSREENSITQHGVSSKSIYIARQYMHYYCNEVLAEPGEGYGSTDL